ncbi:MAG: hypothetical protein HY719_02150 [Planctomycetes bacterium]|nr:hypothetical protein [Planctomycetota bacterium]
MRERFAGILGVFAFLAQVLWGLIRRQNAGETLLTALVFLIVVTLAAWLVALVGARVVGEHINRQPAPSPEQATPGAGTAPAAAAGSSAAAAPLPAAGATPRVS